jgi:glucokinase
MTDQRRAVLEVGGSHVTAAWVDLSADDPVLASHRLSLDSSGNADAILATLVAAGRWLEAEPTAAWAVAFPGPFDYVRGVGLFEGVEKFDALRNVDVRRALAGGLGCRQELLVFVNDADAFALGAWAEGPRHGRSIGLTLGTGVGSGFVDDGRPVDDGDHVPPDGELHFVEYAGRPLEDTVSARAIVAAYTAASGHQLPGAREVADLARNGDALAQQAFRGAFRALGEAVAPWVDRFGAQELTFGGSIAGAWDLVEPAVAQGLHSALAGPMPGLSVAPDAERAALVGAALAAGPR